MTREIKFRAWDKKNKLFITNDDEVKEYMIGLDGKLYRMDFYSNILGEEDGILIWNELKDIILMQYTGLKDKNGKEIYEGDIVGGTLEDGTNGRSPVFWCYNCYQPFSYLNCRSEDLEILGNIYENPELIGDKND